MLRPLQGATHGAASLLVVSLPVTAAIHECPQIPVSAAMRRVYENNYASKGRSPERQRDEMR